MPAARLLLLLDALAAADVEVWVDGGWGVDALLGAQHRPHDDADLVVRLGDVERLLAALEPHGFAVAEDHLPTRLVLRAVGDEQVDLHPVTFDADGHGRQAHAAPDGTDCLYPASEFTYGLIGGRRVPCLSALVQLDHHSGYVPRAHDVDDMRRLSERFDLPLPANYVSAGRSVAAHCDHEPG